MSPRRGDRRPGTSVPGLCLFICIFVAPHAPASAQPVLETKQRFAAALIQLLDALPATYGDEGPRLVAAVEAMEAGLGRWDSSIRASESATAFQIESARPSIAAAMRVPLGALYLERGRFEDAARELTEAARLDPERADIHLFRGLTYAVGGRSSDAEAAFRQAWERDRSNPVGAYLVLQQAAASGRADAARDVLLSLAAADRGTGRQAPFLDVALLDRPSASEPVFPPAAYAEGFRRLADRRYEDAVARFRRDVAGDPVATDPAVRLSAVVQGIAALRRGQIDAAIEGLSAGAAIAPGSSEVHRVLGTAYWLDRQYGQSVEQLAAAVAINPRDERSRLLMADVLTEAEELAKAEQVLREAIGAIPESDQARWKLGRLYQSLGRDAEALQVLAGLKAVPLAGAGRVFATIGALYSAAGEMARAIDAHRLRLAADPNEPAAHRDLADAYLKAGREDEAWAELLAALLIDPADADALSAVGQIHLSAGRFAAAIAELEAAVSRNARHKTARYALGTALLRSGREDEGRRELEVFRQLQSDAIEADHRSYELSQLKLEAALRAGEGKHAEAAAFWRQVAEREPAVAANHARLARALAKAGRHEEAIAAFGHALTADPSAALHRDLAESYMAAGRQSESARERALYKQLREDELRVLGTGR